MCLCEFVLYTLQLLCAWVILVLLKVLSSNIKTVLAVFLLSLVSSEPPVLIFRGDGVDWIFGRPVTEVARQELLGTSLFQFFVL